MFDFANLFVSAAMAQDTAAPPVDTMGQFMNYVPFVAIFIVFYFLVIRPQQKKMDEQGKMIKSLQRGDRIVTSGGIHGKITKIEGDDQLIIEIADNVQVKIERTNVSALQAKPQPVTAIEGEKK